MRLSKPASIAVLVVTLVPLFYVVFFFGTIIFMLIQSTQAPGGNPQADKSWFLALFIAHFCVMILILALAAFYLVYLFKSNDVPKDMKVLWAVVLLFFGMFAMPVFWYLYIWKFIKDSE